METTYITSASTGKQLPDLGKPEIALIGRSNCGKSTLLNALLQRRNLARTSRTPGRTQLIHFFGFGKDVIVADLPGYGFSKIARDVRATWAPLIEQYLRRDVIARFLFLADCRRSWDDEDWMIISHLAASKRLTVVLTKADKLGKNQLRQKVIGTKNELLKRTGGEIPVQAVSGTKKTGITELRDQILAMGKDNG